MFKKDSLSSAIRLALRAGQSATKAHGARKAAQCAIFAGAAAAAALSPAYAQDAADETIVVTGTRIQKPGVVSSSPIYSLGAD